MSETETEPTTALEDATFAYRLAVSAEGDAANAVAMLKGKLSEAESMLARCQSQVRNIGQRLLRIAGGL
jgi:hypothetical protein